MKLAESEIYLCLQFDYIYIFFLKTIPILSISLNKTNSFITEAVIKSRCSQGKPMWQQEAASFSPLFGYRWTQQRQTLAPWGARGNTAKQMAQ